jgi:2-C-methyl-D-erythritol 2,4-cyclodiphosphate synthase
MRIGVGYDLHRLAGGRPLILGGVRIPFDKGLEGHSDADALAHALVDALLGAAALGNIGQHFPETDPRYGGADSLQLLCSTVQLIHNLDYRVHNVDANIIAEQPRLAPYIESIRSNIAECLEVDLNCVSVKAKTNEGVGPEGRGEAISVQAVVLLRRGAES